MSGPERSQGPGDSSRTGPSTMWARSGDALAATLLLFGVVTTGWFVNRLAVNTIYFDQWSDVNLVAHLKSGTLGFGALWAQHNENRIFVPNLIVLLLAESVHLNNRVEVAISACLWWTTCLLLVAAHRRRSPSLGWVWYCPVILVFASFVPLADTLFGFNLSWFLVLVSLAASLFLLDGSVLSRGALAGAVAIAVIGTFSSFQGLLIWPAGVVLLLLRHRPRSQVAAWLASAVLAISLYFIGYNFAATTGQGGALGLTLKFFFFSLGNVFGSDFANGASGAEDVSIAVGIVIFVLAVGAVVQGVRRPVAGAPLGVALITYGLLFSAIATRRTTLGVNAESRYVVFVLTVWLGGYLAVLNPSVVESVGRARRARIGGSIQREPKPSAYPEGAGRRPAWLRNHVFGRSLLPGALALFGLLLVLQFSLGWTPGLDNARGFHAEQLTVADITANIDEAPDSLVSGTLSFDKPAPFIRRMTTVLDKQHLSLFGTNLAAEDRSVGLFPDLIVRIVHPTPGTVVHGTTVLGATVAQTRHLDRLEFTVQRGSAQTMTVANGRPIYGWVGYWATTSTANGVYALRAVLHYAGGRVVTSTPIFVTVDNSVR
jgi:hypothetical protein